MHWPTGLISLLDQGIIEDVVRPLSSGKEAQIYLVTAQGSPYVAKVYKDSDVRSFKNRAEYNEGRGVRRSRDRRAMTKRTKYGRKKEEEAWRSAEVDILYRLHGAGVRVPEPLTFTDGVLVMELITDGDGGPAPLLGQAKLSAAEARRVFDQLLRSVVKMLCVGIVHGDLSEFNVLYGPGGPVIIDFPQSVDSASNNNARKMLIRDVDNLSRFLKRCVPNTPQLPYGQELWDAYENNRLTADIELKGVYRPSKVRISEASMLEEIEDAVREEKERRERAGLPPWSPKKGRKRRNGPRRPAAEARPDAGAGDRRGADTPEKVERRDAGAPKRKRRGGGRRGGRGRSPASPGPGSTAEAPSAETTPASPSKSKRSSKRRRNRRRSRDPATKVAKPPRPEGGDESPPRP